MKLTMAELFDDVTESKYINYRAIDIEGGRKEIESVGYTIIRSLVPIEAILDAREFWLSTYGSQPKLPRVTWAPYLGQANTIGYSKDKFQCLFRSCDFIWNEPFHVVTREICLRLNAIRNQLIGFDPLKGIRYSSDRYGVFVTSSYYPAGDGHMVMHSDGVAKDTPLLHHILPLTNKGIDYASGGMKVVDRSGATVDVDSILKPGDVVFYDGSLMHGVDPIVPLPGSSVGRLQMFAIPTTFSAADKSPSLAANISLKLVAGAKWSYLKNNVRIRFGLSPNLR